MNIFKGFQKGVNLGGWLSQCPLTKERFDSFLTKDDLAAIASAGYDHVRVPVDYRALGFDGETLSGLSAEYLDRCADWCAEYELNLLIDLHNTRGYDFGKPETALTFFKNATDMAYFIALWEAMARKYGANKRIAFELLNEMVLREAAEPWNDLAERTAAAIRRIAPQTPIVIGGVRYNHVTSVKLLRKPAVENIVFNFHCYEPFYFTHQGADWTDIPADFSIGYPDEFEKQKFYLPGDLQRMLEESGATEFNADFFSLLFRDAVRYAEECGAALYCGEYGVIEHGDRESAARWFHDIHAAFEKNGIGRAAWTYRGMSFGLEERGLLEC
ncbi:MAG: cellulase family glycosylhydrolase [Oscillospiraceae bacterium]